VGERAFQVRDPNGVIVQLVDWNGPVTTGVTDRTDHRPEAMGAFVISIGPQASELG
jgi:hypothetical protein